MAEFKRLSDVEVVAEPTESANVLIEENGIIKKAPKDAVGGGAASGGGCDAMIIFENLAYSEYGTFAIGDYQTLYDKINALQEVKVLIGAKQVGGFETKTIFIPIQYQLSNDTINIIIQKQSEFNHQFYIYVNNDIVQAQSQPPT